MLLKYRFLENTGFFIALLLLSVVFQINTLWAQNLPELFNSPAAELSAQPSVDSFSDEKIVSLNFSLINPENNSRVALRAKLVDKIVILLRDRLEIRGKNNYTWVGKVEGDELSVAVITVVNGVAVGHIDFNGEAYSLNPKKGGYQIVKAAPVLARSFYDDARVPVMPQTRDNHKSVSPSGSRVSVTEDGSRVDVLVLYTQQMADAYGSGLAAKIQNFIDLANTAYTDSLVDTQLKLVHSELYTDTNIAEGVNVTNALDYITGYVSGLDPISPVGIQALRYQYNADMVSLLRVYDGVSGYCGLGWIMQDWGVNNDLFANYAFSVVEVKDLDPVTGGKYCDARTFAHELGHNMGCAHDRAHASGQGAYSYSYGYGIDGIFGDIMSYIYPTITYFSTPLVTYSGYPIGKDETDPKSADCAKTISNTRTTVANFMVALDSGCTFTLTSASQTFSPEGGTGSVTVTATPETCTWTVTNTNAWITIDSGNGGTGSGTVNYTVAANTGLARTGTLTIAGKVFTVKQASLYAISGAIKSGGKPLAGVTIALSGDAADTVVTGKDGKYKFAGLPDGSSYTVTPSLKTYAFTPVSSTVTITGADTIQNFTAKRLAVFTLKVISSGGSVTAGTAVINCSNGKPDCSEVYVENVTAPEKVVLTANPKTGYKFASWTGCDSKAGNQCTVTMKKNKTVTALFTKLKTYLLTVKIDPLKSGTVTSEPSGAINCGGSNKLCTAKYYEGTVNDLLLQATPAAGYAFKGWTGCVVPDPSVPATCALTVKNSNKTVTAKLKKL